MTNLNKILYDRQILEFQGDDRWLSNFTLCKVSFGGIEYPSTENAYQAQKSTDMEYRLELADVTPGQSKRRGKNVELRSDWNNVKYDIMLNLTKQKYSDKNPDLKQQLLNTNNVYIQEGNSWGDTYWGVCDGVGYNYLGHIIMAVRRELQKELE